jgi:ferredoxin-NADP reductase
MTLAAAALLAISTAALLLTVFFLVRGALYRPDGHALSLVVGTRIAHPNGWVTLRLRRPRPLAWWPLPAFEAGQSIAVSFPGQRIRRRYSLARWQRLPFSYEITVKPETGGRLSPRLASEAPPGCRLHTGKPDGEFVLPSSGVSKRIVLIAGGVGITPMLAMAEQARTATGIEHVHLYWQARHHTDLVYRDTLDRLARVHGIHLRYLLSRPEQGCGERIDADLLQRELGCLDDCVFLMCAGQAMMDDLVAGLQALSVADEAIHFERFSVAVPSGDTGTWSLRLGARTIPFDHHRSLLDALEEAAIPTNADCRSGTCGQCRVRVVSGQVKPLIATMTDLPDAQVLACCTVPASDLELALTG